MFYLLGLLVAFQLVIGQVLWKIGLERQNADLSLATLMPPKIWSILFSPYILGGLVIYVAATVLYMGMLSKYEYSAVQGLVVPVSLATAIITASWLFRERISLLNLVGLAFLIIGVLLITRR